MTTTAPAPTGTPPREAGRRRRRGAAHLGRRDTAVLAAMLGVPLLLSLALVWGPALLSVALSFTRWNGVGELTDAVPVGLENYRQVVTNYPPFWPALQHNVVWLVVFLVLATPTGLLLAVLLDKELRGTRVYQSAIFLPVVLSLALVGFIWQLVYSRDQGLLNAVLGTDVDWVGDSSINLWAALLAASWRHVGYVMVLFLAGLKGVDPALKEAAALDGAGEVQVFRHVTLPSLAPTSVVVLVITVIEALRAFDLVYVLNRGRNGLELLSVLVTDNIIGEASRIGYGSAVATILLVVSLGVIVPYLVVVLRERRGAS
ncbi:carbohydrate ABC transporter permease [Pseudokineococcus lusitanus]|jgi:multiple sugar transport system permease protein|uniref:Multiple sugar transport system permease protein n=1 Tax=Pseudokineococcus lusitanus TaxID=763993 RepID=A0A3N1G8N2_9ACTN|nr:sugar ABC transporter permease [Pseudokineococcus lusitanus]ROP26609.1 multiple sugar transport system permease protein [Pseudokineococcus lusitanus]